MLRKGERTSIEALESYVLRFGPLTHAQIRVHFGFTENGNFLQNLKKAAKLKSLNKNGKAKVWYHVDGNKPNET